MKTPLVIERGVPYTKVIQWMTDPLISKTILGVTATNPYRFNAPAHGMPPDWLASVVGLMEGCGCASASNPILHRVTVLDADNFEFQDIGEEQGARFLLPPTTLHYRTPFNLAGCTAVMPIYENDDQNSTVLHIASTDNGEILINPATCQIILQIEDTDFDWTQGFYNFDVAPPGAEAKRLLSGTIAVDA